LYVIAVTFFNQKNKKINQNKLLTPQQLSVKVEE